MNLLRYILNRTAVVRAEYAPDGTYCPSLYLLCDGVVADADWERIKGILTIVVVCGNGVVTKLDDAEAVRRIKEDEETFLWSASEGRTSFVRRERLGELFSDLSRRKVYPAGVYCADAASDFGMTAVAYTVQTSRSLLWKRLIRTNDSDSAIAHAVMRRIAFPVLGVFLLMLSGNMFFSSRLYTRRQTLQNELAARERNASESESLGARQRKLLDEFSAGPAVARALVCDRIARVVPERVELSELKIEPPTRRFETGKPLLFREKTAIICGSAPSATDISQFVGRLSELACCRNVRLANVGKERQGDRLEFRIEVEL